MQPGVLAAAAALRDIVCVDDDDDDDHVMRAGEGQTPSAAPPGSESWPASLAALRGTFARAAALGTRTVTVANGDVWQDVSCALRVAAACLGYEQCFLQVQCCQILQRIGEPISEGLLGLMECCG
jgi:hypothetical protein